jgi:hypothetical protein
VITAAILIFLGRAPALSSRAAAVDCYALADCTVERNPAAEQRHDHHEARHHPQQPETLMTTRAKTATTKSMKTPKPAPYHWFQGASVRALVDQLTAADPDTARLEVRVVGKKMTFRVVKTAGENSSMTTLEEPIDIDDSRVCPPICP